MGTLGWLFLWLVGAGALAYHRVSLMTASICAVAALLITTFFSSASILAILALWVIVAPAVAFLNHTDLRRKYLTNPAYEFMQRALPGLSDTEKQALDSGTVSWDGELFSGQPDWQKLLKVSAPALTEEEQAFIDGPVKTVCEMVDDWQVTHYDMDLSQEVWDYLKKEGFFSFIIPKKYGGKEFSAYAHTQIVSILAGRSITLSTTVSVPNSLGPAELLHMYGTEEQKNYYLPRLAKGEDIPCFALTGPDAGSDAGSIPDTGIVCKGQFQGKEIIGIKLNFDKRYITLAPIATLIGLAFKMYDPDKLIGDVEDIGITCALIPDKTPGVTKGRRHYPINIPFQNGTIKGKDVFIPLDWIIGGETMAGQGWRMLVECLSVGRAISLPAACAGGARIASLTSGAYSVVRRQFNTSICKFEGIQEALARIAAFTYISEASRIFTANYIDLGEKPAVPGAIVKYHVTELGRKTSIDAMDIHGGKGIMMGPNNYLARGFESSPIGITVEGANILTRSMIIFGQGAIRCHPYVLREMMAVEEDDFSKFENVLLQHIGFTLSNATKSFFHGITFAKFASSPTKGLEAACYKQLSRASSSFALVTDASMLLLGGKLKFKESLSGRLGDMLSMLYLGSSVLKHYHDQGQHREDFPLVEWAFQWCMNNFWEAMEGVLNNLPSRAVSIGLRVLVMPFGHEIKAPRDYLTRQVSEILTTQNAARERLVGLSFVSEKEDDAVRLCEEAFKALSLVLPVHHRLQDAVKNNLIDEGPFEKVVEAALTAKIITAEEATQLTQTERLCDKVIAVDDFSNQELVNPNQNRRASGDKPKVSSISSAK